MDHTLFDDHLFLPGPTPVPAAVALAQAMAMTDHRGARFEALMADVGERLRLLFGTDGQVVVLPSSGTGGLEAAIVNLFSPGERVLAVVAGVFGQKWAEQAEAMGLAVDRLEVAWGSAVEPERLRSRLADGPYAGVLLTQNETSTGVLQDVEGIGRIVHAEAPDSLFVVDAISGFPAVALPLDAWHVDAAVCGSQKAFMLPPGLAFVALGGRAVAAARGQRPRRYYFDLRPYLDGPPPYTPAVGLYYALEQALGILEREGAAGRERRHRTLMAIVRAGAQAIGLTPLVEGAAASPTVSAFRPPAGVSPKALKAAGADVGALFGGGLARLADEVVRIGHVGYLTPLDAVASVAAAEIALARAGGPPADGRGAQAAVAAWQALDALAAHA